VLVLNFADLNLKFQIGEAIQIRNPGKPPLNSKIYTLDHLKKIFGGSDWAISFPPEISTEGIVAGAEVWLVRES
jgi:hypothetical protein